MKAKTAINLMTIRRGINNDRAYYESLAHDGGQLACGDTTGYCMFSVKPGNDTEEFYEACKQFDRS